MESEIEQYEGFVRDFQAEVERRKEVLRCGLEGIPDEYDIKFGLYFEGQTRPKYSGTTALHHLKGINHYEKIVEICGDVLENLRTKEGSPVEPKAAPTE